MVGEEGQVVLRRQIHQEGRQLALQAFLLQDGPTGEADCTANTAPLFTMAKALNAFNGIYKTFPRNFSYKNAYVSTQIKAQGSSLPVYL